ncbi:hypothetical protein AC630_03320 [Bradyrhizobium sp. AS23.2]|nr:hypothetical protein AC630_03320 [Bradyrhizobium sp. AS23.2]
MCTITGTVAGANSDGLTMVVTSVSLTSVVGSSMSENLMTVSEQLLVVDQIALPLEQNMQAPIAEATAHLGDRSLTCSLCPTFFSAALGDRFLHQRLSPTLLTVFLTVDHPVFFASMRFCVAVSACRQVSLKPTCCSQRADRTFHHRSSRKDGNTHIDDMSRRYESR